MHINRHNPPAENMGLEKNKNENKNVDFNDRGICRNAQDTPKCRNSAAEKSDRYLRMHPHRSIPTCTSLTITTSLYIYSLHISGFVFCYYALLHRSSGRSTQAIASPESGDSVVRLKRPNRSIAKSERGLMLTLSAMKQLAKVRAS